MKRHSPRRVAGTRICARCHAPISEARPVFLVAMPDSRIVGPLHAGCAEREVLALEKGQPSDMDAPLPYGRVMPKAREETLPW